MFNFEDSTTQSDEHSVLSKSVRKKIDNTKDSREKILLKANELRRIYKERQKLGDDFMGEGILNEDLLDDLSFASDELEEDLMNDLKEYRNK